MHRILILLLAFVHADDIKYSNGCRGILYPQCTLPPYPDHGSYVISRDSSKRPGETVCIANLKYTCDTGYRLVGVGINGCVAGIWIEEEPVKCEKFCYLEAHPSVRYLCEVINKTRPCEGEISEGTVIIPECRGGYYASQDLPPMICMDGQWNYVATCLPECGRHESALEIDANTKNTEGQMWTVKEGEVPWHVGIYSKRLRPYRYACGGSIVTPSIVVSAARCFWNGKTVLPSERFAVAAGKLYREWYLPNETHVQTSDVSRIKIPSSFDGKNNNFEDDIALVFLSRHLTYDTYVRPICIDFDIELEKKQLTHGNLGQISGWDLSSEKRNAPQSLRAVRLPYIDTKKCYADASVEYHRFITMDKICAGIMNATALCKADNGGEIAFGEIDGGQLRYYQRGVISTARKSERNCEVHNVVTFTRILHHERFIKEHLSEIERFKCDHGGVILKNHICDGISHCSDGSDETATVCSEISCPPHKFRCEYGGCTAAEICNGVKECPDGSDEIEDLCDNAERNTTQTTCVLPQYPAHGVYQVLNDLDSKPGYSLGSFYLNYTCELGYALTGDKSIYCLNGYMPLDPPTCVPMCRLPEDPSVEYSCQVAGTNGGTRQCEVYEPDGTVAVPNCRADYFSFDFLANIKCTKGAWNRIVTCSAECGKTTPHGLELVSGGRIAKRGELPWHVGVYKQNETHYKQICGGSIIAPSTVVTAAHCFWTETETLRPEQYAVAAGKLYKGWDDPRDDKVQKTHVKDVIIPERFLGPKTHFQEDIALVFLSTPLTYDVHIRPVCLNFEAVLDARQLAVGNFGKVAGWGLVDENGSRIDELKVVDLPYIDIKECFEDVPASFREHITADKICAGYTNGTALCRGDSGGGLVFAATDRETERYYLRGVVSTAAADDNKSCNTKAITSFTHILRQQLFIQKHYLGA